jgi:chromosome partitioning protein
VIKISKKATTIAIVNQKGGTGKTTTCENLGVGLAAEGKKVLLVDADSQGSLTISMGWQKPDELPATLSTLMQKAMNDQCIPPGEGVLHHAEGVDLIPANIELAGLEVALVNTMSREKMLKQVLDSAKQDYDYILLDCTPSLGMLTINALAAADTALIPVQAQYLSAKGLEQLLQTINKVHRQINPKLKIEGILLTMTDNRTNYGRQIDTLIRQSGRHTESTSKCSVRRFPTPSVQRKSARRVRASLSMTRKAKWQKLIHELRLMQCYLMPDETALRELSESVIEKLKLLTDAEFAELEFPLD